MSRQGLFSNEEPAPVIQCADRLLMLSRPRIMGILNLTPDSFFDGGKYQSQASVLFRVEQMIAEGADIIDVGAESTRAYATELPLQEEIDRLLATLTAIKERFDILLSVDTYKPRVMQEAIQSGAHIINDIYALQQPSALDVIATSQVAVVLMHMQNTPATMQTKPDYHQVVMEVGEFFVQRTELCLNAGIASNRIIIDPGFGFGKTTVHNMQLLKNLREFKKIQFPILAGLSRKFSIGELLSLPVAERLYGSISAHVIAVQNGASIIRTHDIKPTVEALKIAEAVIRQESLQWQ